MAPINTVDDIASALAVAQDFRVMKIFTTLKAAGAMQSGWLATGTPAAGVAPPAYTAGSGYTCSRTTQGALGQANGATQLWLMMMNLASTVRGTILLYDRLWSCGGMGFAAATYTVTTPGALPARVTNGGLKAHAFVEQFVAAGAASGTLTLNYLDSAGAAKQGVISAVVSAPVAGQLQPIPLSAVATVNGGISQVTSAVNSATWTSGSFGITIMELIAAIPTTVIGAMGPGDWTAVLEQVPTDACLQFAFIGETTTAPTLMGMIKIGDK